uniref:Uncharacterized protein n=1 Tax=Pipistrellus kuhlii TaxID=59472 RepID=A0A7J7RMC9_PIPKU|nr:hypothetical protein mPipKuh1_010404 [Pipistrellus kuhlii]
MAENVPNLVKEKVTQAREAQRTPSRKNTNRPMPRHIIIKTPKIKDKERILKAEREKQTVTYKGASIRLTPDSLSETLQARREWHEVLMVMESKDLRLRVLFPAKLSFKVDSQIKSFPEKRKKKKKRLKEYITTNPALEEMLRGLL